METFEKKFEKVKKIIEEKGKNGAIIAFSGGIDSSTLAAVSHCVLGGKAVAVVATSPTYTPEELTEAKKLAKEIGIRLYIVHTDELSIESFCANPENRCYYCKQELLKCIKAVANDLGFETVFEGTNFSDLADHRPGFKAVQEMKNVLSPWVDNGFTKEEIRALAGKIGLSVQNKPALACLASRIPYNERITVVKLKRIARAERTIRRLTGVRQIRVRDHNGLARIEVGKDERKLLTSVEIMNKIDAGLKRLGFKYVTIDLEGYRTGSLLHALE